MGVYRIDVPFVGLLYASKNGAYVATVILKLFQQFFGVDHFY